MKTTHRMGYTLVSVVLACVTACEAPVEQASTTPEPPSGRSSSVDEPEAPRALVAEREEPDPEPDVHREVGEHDAGSDASYRRRAVLPWSAGSPSLKAVRSHAKCYEMDGREGTFLCALHRAGKETPFAHGRILLGEVSAMHSFSETISLSPDTRTTPRSAVSIDFTYGGPYTRLKRGVLERERARRKGHVYRVDHATGEFFTDGPERRYDQGQAPLFMRKDEVAALRCGDTLLRFTRLSEERTRRLFDEGVFDIYEHDALLGAYDDHKINWVRGKNAPRGGDPVSKSGGNPCPMLMGPEDAEEKRQAEAVSAIYKELRAIETLRRVRWCLDPDAERPWADPNAHVTMKERMGKRVARDAVELAERLYAAMPDDEEEYRKNGFDPSDLKPIYKWWTRLDYGAPREAARIEAVTSSPGEPPKSLRLENHTREGKRFKLTFGRCAHEELLPKEERDPPKQLRRCGSRCGSRR